MIKVLACTAVAILLTIWISQTNQKRNSSKLLPCHYDCMVDPCEL